MALYRKKPVVVEAYKTDKELIIHTLEGDMKANVGDYIITGVKGEQYPCKPDIFELTYQEVKGQNDAVAPIADTVKKIIERLSDEYEFKWHADIDTRELSRSDLIEWVTEIAAELLENPENGSFFERECLMKEQPLFECLNCAYEDERRANDGDKED